ncbi:hypothetical protein RGQ15_12095 [Paracoccus sp. MBLB3053]|uniref:SPOR domain-containing protein n=1 Tax=Paracoccus aurantius TaxID=3073814 RepID=A0ABU2HTD5_9RHOB|nr:hypothetical protein [Paracoccus sp. MBLB3053]MDS9468307.1 hypothetical protein [Paracoccus sp. MBLB3053]
MRLLWVAVVLIILAVVGLTGYAYFGDMKADPREMRLPVQLDLGSEPAAPAPAAAISDMSGAPEASAEEPSETGQDELD